MARKHKKRKPATVFHIDAGILFTFQSLFQAPNRPEGGR